MNATLLSFGNELLLGRTVDTNTSWLARELAGLGISVVGATIVGDDLASIRDAFVRAAQRADLVLATGGLGPTGDDLTRQGLADACGVALVDDADSLRRMQAFFRRLGRPMADINRVQARLPQRAEALANDEGTAPGIAASLEGAKIFVMPGVPREMRAMFLARVRPRLVRGGNVVLAEMIRCFGTGESVIGAKIADLISAGQAGKGPSVGTTVNDGLIGIRIAAEAPSESAARDAIEPVAETIERRLGDWVLGRGDTTPSSAAAQCLLRANATVVTAESCTGGLLAKMFTDVPGSSAWFLEGEVCYSNAAKIARLGVPAELIESHGAVSEPVCRAMTEGALRTMGGSYALALTGIAGPTGGNPEKPVGLVFVGQGSQSGKSKTALEGGSFNCRVEKYVFPGDRATVRLRAAHTALNLLRLALKHR